uniref:Sepiapterin reductase n=1 Tax=Caligus rogercresseyi TaxID=217165 RepID=C1BRD5_CALRO|nr:Sepiapterin reductase [Caligus rogercresseyi]|eukprot:TRINITY_DN3302_c0_g1_i1.p1 TRINITY_DN3302_c0_g1~~TRINITY_DN3302_c0_g1_i1.p1  ORF type:complete len:257 (+),score=50.05 TRINITY_DN3302_c0_g1_i1:50-820(+)
MKVDKKFILVTGASKGFGRSIATKWAEFCAAGSKIILTARSLEGLTETEKRINSINPDIKVIKFVTDHGKPVKSEYESLYEKEVNSPQTKYDSGFLFHNVGVVEPQGDKLKDINDLKEMEDYFRLNLFSVMILNSVFFPLKKLLSSPLTIVNVSSLASVLPIPTWGYYCSGKAARQVYFNVMAKEEEDVRVLNYSPGAMDTSAIDRLRESPKTIDFIKDFWKNGLINPDISVEKMAKIIEKNEYISGTQIDFFDEF